MGQYSLKALLAVTICCAIAFGLLRAGWLCPLMVCVLVGMEYCLWMHPKHPLSYLKRAIDRTADAVATIGGGALLGFLTPISLGSWGLFFDPLTAAAIGALGGLALALYREKSERDQKPG